MKASKYNVPSFPKSLTFTALFVCVLCSVLYFVVIAVIWMGNKDLRCVCHHD